MPPTATSRVAAFALSGGLYAVDLGRGRRERSSEPRRARARSSTRGRRRTARASPTSPAARCGWWASTARATGPWPSPPTTSRRAAWSTSSPPRSSSARAASGGRPTPPRCWSSGSTRRRCQEWWIADPVHPEQAPRRASLSRRGTANADVSLELVQLDGGGAVAVGWDHDRFPYLVDVTWQPGRNPLLVVMTRDPARPGRARGAPRDRHDDRRGRDPRRRLGRCRTRGDPVVAAGRAADAARRPRQRHLPAAPRRPVALPRAPAGPRCRRGGRHRRARRHRTRPAGLGSGAGRMGRQRRRRRPAGRLDHRAPLRWHLRAA